MYINVLHRSVSVEGTAHGPHPELVREICIFSTVSPHCRVVLYDGALGQDSPAFTIQQLRELAENANAASPSDNPIDNAAQPVAESTGADVQASSNEAPAKV